MVRNVWVWAVLASIAVGSACPVAAQTGDAGPAAPITGPSTQDQAFAADFERFLEQAMARFPSMPAISVAIVHRGVPVFVKAKGRADIEAGIRATPDTPFYIASSTKSFVGTALALLDARGTIDLDWTMRELAPDVAFAPDIPADKITLRDLLSHRHGLAGDAMAFRLAYSGDYDAATLSRLLAQIKPDPETPFGTFRYGNSGYNIAALLIERRTGRRWQDIVQGELLGPLAMTETLTEGLANRSGPPVAAPYRGAERLYLVKDDRTMHAAGGMYASANDMARWLALQLADGGELAQAAAAARAPVAALDTSFGPFRRTGYGLGWYAGPYAEQTLYHAFGSFVGARACVGAARRQTGGCGGGE